MAAGMYGPRGSEDSWPPKGFIHGDEFSFQKEEEGRQKGKIPGSIKPVTIEMNEAKVLIKKQVRKLNKLLKKDDDSDAPKITALVKGIIAIFDNVGIKKDIDTRMNYVDECIGKTLLGKQKCKAAQSYIRTALGFIQTEGGTSPEIRPPKELSQSLSKTRASDVSKFRAFEGVKLTGLYLNELHEEFPNLTEIEFPHCSGISPDFIIGLAHRFPKLKSITLSGSEVTDDCIKALARGFKDLETLNLPCCLNLTDESVRELHYGDNCRKLCSLNISLNENIRGTPLIDLVKARPSLKTINITNTYNIRDFAVHELRSMDIMVIE